MKKTESKITKDRLYSPPTYHEDGRFVRLTISIRLRGILSTFNLSQFDINLTGCSRADSAEEFTLEAREPANDQKRKRG